MKCSTVRIVGLIVLGVLSLGACSERSSSEVDQGQVTLTSAPDAAAPAPEQVETWAVEVADLLDAEAEAFMAAMVEMDFKSFDDLVAQEMWMCAQQAEFRSDVTVAMAVLPEPPASVKTSFGEYLEARGASDDALAGSCEVLELNADLLRTHAAAGHSDFIGVPELEGVSTALTDAVRAQGLACGSLQEAVAESGVVLNCAGETEPPPGPVEAAPMEPEPVRDDLDPTQGPTGGPAAGRFLLAAGPGEFSWFPVPFTLDHSDPLSVVSGEDYIWLSGGARTWPRVELYAPAALADPNNPGSFNLLDEIPVPESLGGWLEDMPVEVLESAPFETAGSTGTRWLVTVDRDAAIELTSEPTIALWASVSGDFFIHGFNENELPENAEIGAEQRYIWEIRAPDGRLLVAQELFADPFEPGHSELVTWVEAVLATLAFPPADNASEEAREALPTPRWVDAPIRALIPRHFR